MRREGEREREVRIKSKWEGAHNRSMVPCVLGHKEKSVEIGSVVHTLILYTSSLTTISRNRLYDVECQKSEVTREALNSR